MTADETGQPPAGADEPNTVVRRAIDWFTHDTQPTRQNLHTQQGPTTAGAHLLAAARFEIELHQLPADPLVSVQAEWLIRHMPADHDHLGLDSAQQAGRAWGILVAPDLNSEETQLTREVITAVAGRTGMSGRVVDEIAAQARATSAAFHRAEQLAYDHASVEDLTQDWNQLAACGNDLPDSVQLAQDVLYLLTARLSGPEHNGMDDAAQHAAQLLKTVIQAQPLLSYITSLAPMSADADVNAGLRRVLDWRENGLLAAAATAAARARAVQEWRERDFGSDKVRPRQMEGAGAGVRALLALNSALAALDPSSDRASPRPLIQVLTGHGGGDDLARIIATFRRLADSARARRQSDPLNSTHATHDQTTQQQRRPPLGPEGGRSPTPR